MQCTILYIYFCYYSKWFMKSSKSIYFYYFIQYISTSLFIFKRVFYISNYASCFYDDFWILKAFYLWIWKINKYKVFHRKQCVSFREIVDETIPISYRHSKILLIFDWRNIYAWDDINWTLIGPDFRLVSFLINNNNSEFIFAAIW